jgi:hypothetical protein
MLRNHAPQRTTLTVPPAAASRGWLRALPVGLTIVMLVLAVLGLVSTYNGELGQQYFAVDITHYLDATRRWLETGSPYLPSEVAAPFLFQPLTFLHPPLSLYLFVPFLVLPLALWWAIPIGIVCWALWSWRPDRWAGPLIAFCLIWPRTPGMLVVGNTDLWVTAFLALGLRFGWPALLIAIKPSFAPFMLAGSRARSWRLGLPILALAAVPFGTLWLEWFAVARNAPMGVTYSVLHVPMLLIPVIAWLRRTRHRNVAVDDAAPSRGGIAGTLDQLRATLARPFRHEAG